MLNDIVDVSAENTSSGGTAAKIISKRRARVIYRRQYRSPVCFLASVPGNIRGPAAFVTGTTGTYTGISAAYWPCTLNDAGTATQPVQSSPDVRHPELTHGGKPMSDNPDRKQPIIIQSPATGAVRCRTVACSVYRPQQGTISGRHSRRREARWRSRPSRLILQQMVTMASPRLTTGGTDAACSPQRPTPESEPGPQGAVSLMIYPKSDESLSE